jgi:hypothetical protein
MESVLLAAMITAASPIAPANEPAVVAALDQRCFRLMADLAEDGDPRIRGLGRTAAQYFLGRIDAARPGFDSDAALEAPAPQGSERTRLLGACGNAMSAGGRDFRSIGEALAPPTRPTI